MPSIDDRKKQKFKKHFEENTKSLESEGSLHTELPENISVSAQKKPTQAIPIKSKALIQAEKQRKHLKK